MGQVTGINDRKNLREWDKIRADLDKPAKPQPKPSK